MHNSAWLHGGQPSTLQLSDVCFQGRSIHTTEAIGKNGIRSQMPASSRGSQYQNPVSFQYCICPLATTQYCIVDTSSRKVFGIGPFTREDVRWDFGMGEGAHIDFTPGIL